MAYFGLFLVVAMGLIVSTLTWMSADFLTCPVRLPAWHYFPVCDTMRKERNSFRCLHGYLLAWYVLPLFTHGELEINHH